MISYQFLSWVFIWCDNPWYFAGHLSQQFLFNARSVHLMDRNWFSQSDCSFTRKHWKRLQLVLTLPRSEQFMKCTFMGVMGSFLMSVADFPVLECMGVHCRLPCFGVHGTALAPQSCLLWEVYTPQLVRWTWSLQAWRKSLNHTFIGCLERSICFWLTQACLETFS